MFIAPRLSINSPTQKQPRTSLGRLNPGFGSRSPKIQISPFPVNSVEENMQVVVRKAAQQPAPVLRAAKSCRLGGFPVTIVAAGHW